ncbi:MAG TPA: hypothetical protein VNN72_00510, partial [Polyangiaceae bacterium]|nr:hypothetical protein [Polyangiaceae bacterium]
LHQGSGATVSTLSPLQLIRRLAKAHAILRGLLLLLVVTGGAALGAARHDATPHFARGAGESHAVLSAGVAQHGAKALAQRAQPLLVAATPLIERAAAIPALPAQPGAHRTKARALESHGPPSQVQVAVVRWRRHAPRMDSGDPPRSTPFAS